MKAYGDGNITFVECEANEKRPTCWHVSMEDPEDVATEENDIEPDTAWRTREEAVKHAQRILARMPEAEVGVVECVIRDRQMSDDEYKEHRLQ